jgi:hypothetical protein
MTRKTLGFTATILVVLSFSGCGVSSTGPMIAGNNIYKITHQEGAIPTQTGSEMLKSALKEAREFCDKKNKDINILATDANLGPYVLGRFPVGSITFSCSDTKEQSDKILLPTAAPRW